MGASTVVKTTGANRRVAERNTDRSIDRSSVSLYCGVLASVLDGRVCFLFFAVLSLFAFIWFVVLVAGWFATFVGRLRRTYLALESPTNSYTPPLPPLPPPRWYDIDVPSTPPTPPPASSASLFFLSFSQPVNCFVCGDTIR